MTPGRVYVVASRSHPGIVKIGRTSQHPSVRREQLDAAYGYRSFGPWDPVWSTPVADSCHVEAAAHRLLAHRRVRLKWLQCREMFRATPDEACRAVQSACQSRRVCVPRRPAVVQPHGLRLPGIWVSAAIVLCALLGWL